MHDQNEGLVEAYALHLTPGSQNGIKSHNGVTKRSKKDGFTRLKVLLQKRQRCKKSERNAWERDNLILPVQLKMPLQTG